MSVTTIHAGHGGIDPGACANGKREADIARVYKNKLIGLTGAFDATDDSATSVNDNLNKIVGKVNSKSSNEDWNLSIHLNAASPAATGVEVFYYGSDTVGRNKAAEVSQKLASVYGIPDRGAKDGTGLFVINSTKGHMLLIELGFITNTNDIQQLESKVDQACKAIVSCFGYSGDQMTPTSAPKPQQAAKVTAQSQPQTQTQTSGYAREYNETGTMYATEANWVKRTPTKAAPILEWQSVGQPIKYHKVLWSDGIVWLQLNYGGGGQAFVAYADASGTGFGRKYGYCK